MDDQRKDVLLDILSPDNNALYGTFLNYSRKAQLAILQRSLNVAVLLCGERCLVPPFFPLEWRVARLALEGSSDFLIDGVIVFPVRESSIAEFVVKKELEYAGVRSDYKGVYSREAARFLRRHAQGVVKRRAYVGQAIVPIWEAGPDTSLVWSPIRASASVTLVEQVRKAPYWLKENGESITWAGMRRLLPQEADAVHFEINQALQHEYMQIYLREYDATIVSRLPPKTTDLLLASANLSYDYVCWTNAMRTLSLWPAIGGLQAESVLRLRNTYGFLRFMAAFETLCVESGTSRGVQTVVAAAAASLRNTRTAKRVSTIEELMRHTRQIPRTAANVVSDYLATIAARVAVQRNAAHDIVSMNFQNGKEGTVSNRADVVLITALREERDAILAKLGAYRKLDKDGADVHTYYEAQINTCRSDAAVYRVIVTSLADMGPLMAHGKAQAVVARWHPTHVILLGIACGLPSETSHGDVMIAKLVADYSLGKILPSGRREVRWSSNPAGPNLLDAAMNLPETWTSLISADRPDTGKPQIVFGVIASGGDVITSDEIVTAYQSDWPKLIGVEMEGGGTASGLHNTPDRPEFLMVKAVSDFGKDKHDPVVKPWRPYACEVSAAFVIALLREGLGPPVRRLSESNPSTM